MQHMVIRNGAQQWVSDGEPSEEALSAAARVELARLLGVEWKEADDELADQATDDEEHAAALAYFENRIDLVMARLLADVTDWQTQLAARAAAMAVRQ